jgi:crotonobetainyl-CoA:carnitine CoA-transferase CaiB-like acyl-CoA transferase
LATRWSPTCGPALAALRITYNDVVQVAPQIVYCQAQGFPTDSPRANDPTYDDIIQSASAVADAYLRATRQPSQAPTINADKVCGLTIVYAVPAALLYRANTGLVQRVEAPMTDAMTAFMLAEHGAAAISRSDRQPAPHDHGYHRIPTPNRRPQPTKDGWIHILPYTATHSDLLFKLGGRDDLIGDQRCPDTHARQLLVHDAELALERSGPERFLSTYPLITHIVRAAAEAGGDLHLRRIGAMLSQLSALRRMSIAVAAGLAAGADAEVPAALVKDLGTRFERDVIDVARDVLTGSLDPTSADVGASLLTQAVLQSPGFTIRGGTNEILRGVIAKGLGLR